MPQMTAGRHDPTDDRGAGGFPCRLPQTTRDPTEDTEAPRHKHPHQEPKQPTQHLTTWAHSFLI